MGFDNECIVNIQSLAGEYFCPVCRTLVYPNEALQSQCTHLYCKPCLIYVVGTTKACPYDGYLVTEADSKPLVESDKALAEKIAKTQVHCLFHRSGCPWQGPLSECTSHCSGCTFGNSPVVCNRCGIQIVHRQVQEHAQNCAGANPQAQQTSEGSKDAGTTATATTANPSQASSQLVQPSQGPASQTSIAPASVHNANSQVQGIASAAGTTADQWYPQQFQQYYQQYPGYDPYQQAYMQFYPYQQQTGQAFQQHAPHVVGQPQVYAQHPIANQPHHQPLQQVQGQAQTQPQIQLQPQPLAQQQQPQIPPQGQPQAQSYAQNQVNPQQSHPAPQPHPQLQPHNQPAAQGQVPPQQPYPQAQPHLPPHSMQPPVQQNFQAPQYQQAQSQGHQVQPQMQPRPILQAHPQSHSHLHPSQLNNPQSQQPAPHVGPGYHPPVQPQQQIPQVPPQQNSMQMHPISGSFPPAAQFPQQSPHMRPPQANASVPSQQQSNLMPGHSQMQGVPLAQHHQLRPQNQQGLIGHQRPAAQPMQPQLQQYGQQSFPMQGSGSGQGPLHQLPFAQQPMHAPSRLQGPTQLQHGTSAPLPPPPHSNMQAHGIPHQQPQAYAGRPVAPNQMAQPYMQSVGAFGVDTHSGPMPSSSVQLSGHQNFEGGISNQQQSSSGPQFSQSGLAVKHTTMGEGNAVGQEVGSGSNRTTGKDVSGAGVDSIGNKTVESETGERSGDKDHRVTSEGESNGTHKGITGKVVDAEVDALKLGSAEKKTVSEEDANGNLDSSSGGDKIEAATVDEKNGNVAPKQSEYSSVTDSTLKQSEAYVGHKKDETTDMTQENNLSHEKVNPQGSVVNEYSGFQDKNSMNSSNPSPYGPSSHQQRPTVPSNQQSGPYPGSMPNTLLPGQGHAHLRPPGPGLSGPPRQSHYPSQPLPHSGSSHDIAIGGQPTPESVHPHESFEGVQSRQHYQNNPPHPQPVFSRTLNADPTGGPLPGPDGAAMHQNQRPHPFDGRYPEPHVSGPFDRGHLANENHAPGYEGLRAKNVADDHRNPFLAGPPGREYDDASKQFPKPAIMGVDPSSNLGNGFSSRAGDYPPHEFNYDAPSRFLPPYHPSGAFHPNDIGERPTGFHEDHRARGYSARPQPDFHGSGPGFGADHLPPRSPGREYHGIPLRGFGGPSGGPHIQSGLEDIHTRDTRTIHEGSRSSDISLDPAGKPFREQFRNGDMRGQDFTPNHMRRGELFGPRNGPSHMVGGDGFGPFPDLRIGDMTGQGSYPHNESFAGNNANHLRLGEPGYRSSYSLHGFPSDGGFYAGNTDSFDRFRRRMPSSMGWCRICKVDCDTVDGLDLHSQTMEHQQRTMDMVISIKQQNSKRQKMSKDHTSTEDGSRSRNPGNRGRGKKA